MVAMQEDIVRHRKRSEMGDTKLKKTAVFFLSGFLFLVRLSWSVRVQ